MMEIEREKMKEEKWARRGREIFFFVVVVVVVAASSA